MSECGKSVQGDRLIYNVLGAERSGTSLTANILSDLGVYFGETDQLLAADGSNPKGYYENHGSLKTNDLIDFENGVTLFHLSETFHTQYFEKMKDVLLYLSSSNHDCIGVKEPKMCFYRGLWSPVFQKMGYQERAIVVFRHPYESACSRVNMEKVNMEKLHMEKKDNIDIHYMLLRWLEFNCNMLEQLMEINNEDVLILNYEDYFTKPDAQIGKIKAFLKINDDEKKGAYNVIDKRLKRNDYRTIQLSDSELVKCVMNVYNFLVRLAKEEAELNEEVVLHYKKQFKMILNSGEYPIDNQTMRKVFPEVFGVRKEKKWCWIQMSENEKAVDLVKQYCLEHNIHKIALYGNGDLAKCFYDMVEKLPEIELTNIYDQREGAEVIVGGCKYVTSKLTQDNKPKSDVTIVNTIFYYDEVVKMLKNCATDNEILSLYDFLVEAIG